MPANTLPRQLQATADYIENLQLPSGALPWFAGGITDPWDHVEALMGLTVAGRFDASLKGFEWLSRTQRCDGAWYAAYEDEAIASPCCRVCQPGVPEHSARSAAMVGHMQSHC